MIVYREIMVLHCMHKQILTQGILSQAGHKMGVLTDCPLWLSRLPNKLNMMMDK